MNKSRHYDDMMVIMSAIDSFYKYPLRGHKAKTKQLIKAARNMGFTDAEIEELFQVYPSEIEANTKD